MKPLIPIALAVIMTAPLAARAETVEVTQTHRSFQPNSVTIHPGDTVRIVNHDEFIHNVYVESPTFQFDSEEQLQGQTQDIVFPRAGDFEVHCHIHLKMKLEVHVR